MTKKTTKPNEEIEQLQSQLADAQTNWKRALADYQNLEKRVADQKSTYLKLANLSLITRLITIIDDLKRAGAHLSDQGLNMVIAQLDTLLKDEGLAIIETEGQNFDPHSMECAEVVPGEKDQVIETIQVGYRLNDQVIRAAKVTVGSGLSQSDHTQATDN